MKTDSSKNTKEENTGAKLILKYCLIAMFIFVGTSFSHAQSSDEGGNPEARVTGLKYICVHVL